MGIINERVFSVSFIPLKTSNLFLRPNFYAVIFCTLFLALYAPITLLIIFRTYEKTQAPEIIFFAGFLFSCSLEILRLIIPFTPEYTQSIALHLIIGRVIYFSRFFACLSFLFAAIFAQSSETQETDKNIIFIATVAIIVAALTPINTTVVYSALFIQYGFIIEVMAIKILFNAITAFSFFIIAYKENIAEYKHIAIGSIIISTGYAILCVNDNIFFGIFGCLALAFGTHLYLNNLHKYYLWR
ncbi:MAG: hypothetical protein ACRC4W_03655 [Treponemataceae bacterium]